jgi:hypothetical protein
MNDYLSEVFGDGGLFASRFPCRSTRAARTFAAPVIQGRGGGHAALPSEEAAYARAS